MAKAKKGRPTNPKSKLSRARAMFNRKMPRQDMQPEYDSSKVAIDICRACPE